MNINIIFKNNDSTLNFAAKELKSYLSLLDIDLSFTENNPADTFTLRLEAASSLSRYCMPEVSIPELDDQFFIDVTSDGGLIAGTNSRSVLLGVYSYLAAIGFRFLYPDKKRDYIPQIHSLKELFASYGKTALHRHRGVCIEGANSLQNILDFIEWMPKLGYNSFFVQFRIPYTFLARWYEHEKNPYIRKEDFNEDIATAYNDIIDREIHKRSLLHHRVGHGWTCETIGYPSLGWTESGTAPAGDIRPYLAEINGKRDFFNGVPINTNLCYSNPDVIETFTNEVIDYAKKNPDIDYLHIWIADEFNNICECDQCQKTTPSDQYINLLNIIDGKMTQAGIKTRLVFLLYQELLWAPQKERLHNPDRFTLMFAPISRTFENSYSINTETRKPPEYCRNQIELPLDLEENLSFLREWQQIFSGDSFVYDYPLGRAHYGDLGYTSIAKVISSDIKQLDSLNMNGYISCQELRAGLPNSLPNYVMGLTLYDSAIPFNELQADYFMHAYGEDYLTALNYLDKISALNSPDYFNGKGERENPEQHNRYKNCAELIRNFRPTIREIADRYTKAAAASSPNAGIHEFFWKLLDYHADYSLRLTEALSALSASKKEEADELWKTFHAFICSNEETCQAPLDVYRITEVGTKYTGFSLEA